MEKLLRGKGDVNDVGTRVGWKRREADIARPEKGVNEWGMCRGPED